MYGLADGGCGLRVCGVVDACDDDAESERPMLAGRPSVAYVIAALR